MIVTRTFSAFAFGFIAAALLAPLSARAHDDGTPKRFISLTVTGQVATKPDQVDISTGVTSQAETAKQALANNSEAMAEVVAALKAEGIDAKDIQTSEFSVQPLYEERKEGVTRSPNIVGYQVTNSVHLTLHDPAKLGTILDKVVSLGANEINAIEFGVSEPAPLKDEARKRAMKEAFATAKLYAEAAGANLGNVLTITEEAGIVVPRASGRVMEMKAPAPPIEAGTAMVEVRINVTFALE